MEPVFFEREFVSYLESAAVAVRHAIDRVEEAARSSPSLLRYMLGDGRLFNLACAGRCHPPEFVGRMDGFRGYDGTVKFVEYNPGSCGGMFFADACLDLFNGLPTMESVRRDWKVEGQLLAECYWRNLAAAVQAAGRGEIFELSVVLPQFAGAEALAQSPEVAALRSMHERNGGAFRLVKPSALEHVGNRLIAAGSHIDVALVLDWTDLTAALPENHAIWRSAEGDGTFIVNPLSAFLIRGAKSVFAVLSDEQFRPLFDESTARVLDRHVPWTRMVERDAASSICAGKNDLVLKPVFSIGGREVVLGWEVDDDTWAKSVERACDGGFVVQRRVEIPSRSFQCIDQDGVVTASRFLDVCPFLWSDGRSEGIFVRTSGNSLLNMSAGTGSAAAVYVVEGPRPQ